MSALLLSLILLTQGIPVAPQQTGTVTGVLKDSDGKPLPGIRMAAVAKPESLAEALASAAMSSIAETDPEGRYKLENVPPGRYFIAAGRLDLQTYFPGTPDIAAAKEVSVTAGATTSGIDFALNDFSFGRASTIGSSAPSALIPLRVTIEGGGPVPLSGDGKLTEVRLEMMGSTVTAALNTASLSVPGPTTTSFVVTVENLPETFVVKSMLYGPTNLLTNPLRLTPSNFPSPANLQMPVGPPLPVRQYEQDLLTYLTALLNARNSAPAAPTTPTYTAPDTLSLVLSRVAPRTTTGVRVSGRARNLGARTVYLSGIPGNYYSDGSFEVHGVPPGAYVLATRGGRNGSPPLAASLVVGSENLDGVVLEESALVPESVFERSEPRPAGNRPPGVVPLGRIIGTAVEEVSRQPVREGSAVLRAGRGASLELPISTEGRFEFPRLLPGRYELAIQVFGHSVVKQPIEITDTDITVEVAPRKLY
jgi:hypothetical protein